MTSRNSPNVTEFLSQLRELDVRLTLQFDRLNCSAPKGALTAELQAELVRRKPELIELLRASADGDVYQSIVARISRTGELPLSHGQQRLWFLSLYEPESTAYHISASVRITGALEGDLLERTLAEIIRRHEALRTGYINEAGKPCALITSGQGWRLERIELDRLAVPERAKEAFRLARHRVREPFDLADPPLIRATLFKLAEFEHILLVAVHHIAADGWSLAVLASEIGVLYPAFQRGVKPAIDELPFQFVDYVAWYRKACDERIIERQLAWWLRHLQGPLPVLELPSDRPRPPVMSDRGAYLRRTLEDVAGLVEFANSSGATLFMVLLSAFKILLHRYTGQKDLIVGTAVAGRNRAEVENMIGLFINTLALRTSLEGDPTVTEVLDRVRETALGAFAHADVPFDRLVAELQPARDLSHSPVIQVVLTLQNYPYTPLELAGLTLSPEPFNAGISRYDLTVDVFQRSDVLDLSFEYNTDLFDASTIQGMQDHFVTILARMVAEPASRISEIALLSESERAELLSTAEPPRTSFPVDRCVHDLIREQCLRAPERVAVSCGTAELTYHELDELSDRLAARLEKSGIRPGVIAGVCLERSIRLPVALLAVLKAGGAYVPLDLQYPQERLTTMLEDSGAAVLVTEFSLVGKLPSWDIPIVLLDDDLAPDRGRPGNVATPSDLAYVLYTSGSTGKPKGVEIPHRALVNFLWSMRQRPGICADDCLLQVTTLSFDIAGLEIYLPLLVGARVEIAARAAVRDPAALGRLIEESRVTVMQATPAMWRMLFDSGWNGCPGLKVLCGGDTLSRELSDQLLNGCGEVWNLYGPTETTIWSTAARLRRGMECIPLGEPVANTYLYILDAHKQLVPKGVDGELYIGGEGLARGYRDRPELTRERFVENPFRPGERLYRTGDLARYRADGGLEFLGRADLQVKIRGYRIEPEEIEKVIELQPGVRHAVVEADRSGTDVHLTAYVVCRREDRPRVEDLKTALGQILPDYMVPAFFVFLESLPLSPNGKLNRKALPKPDLRAGTSALFEPPRSQVEREVANLWQGLLKVDQVGIHDNFFDLGGHSLLVVQMQSRLQQCFGRELALIELFQRPTVAAIAASFATEVMAGPRA
jgi:amino acid adenylation domain-containing protein